MTTIEVSSRSSARPQRSIEVGLLWWLATGCAVLAIFFLSSEFAYLAAVDPEQAIPVAPWVKAAMTWFTDHTRWVFRGATWLLAWPLGGVRAVLQWLPWPSTVLLCTLLGFFAGGWRLAAFCGLAMLYMVVVGYWEETTYTLALAGVAVPISILAGLFIGILGYRWKAARRAIEPALDLMQTVPTFAYLIPILVLFGIGPVVGMVASAIYAIPPMVRNVMLGLERVPSEIVESAAMSGSTGWQLLWWVQVPTAMPAILIGVNQTIMAGLSMVVIAAMVGGAPDMGLEVYNTMKKAQFGESILAGLVIALLAMIMDRVSRGLANRRADLQPAEATIRRRVIPGVIGVVILLSLAAVVWPDLRRYPEAWVVYPAHALNSALEWFTVTFFSVTSAVKTWFVFYLLLPLKIGLIESVRPRYWGFEMNATASTVYALLIAAIAGVATYLSSWRAAVGVAVIGIIYYFGTTGIPWPASILVVAVLAYQTGGWRTAALAVAGLSFIVLTGVWESAMVSIQLCGAAVLIAFVIGSGLGVWAAMNAHVSAFLRPISDTLQTIPIFVFLIPAVMVFLVGEFTALIAVIMYAIVPSIRYTEHGIRNVPTDVVEAARSFGATRQQLLWHVQLPLALPEIMLGLNQTIMMGLAMVIVAALVGARGLGQEVMVALQRADTGLGVVSGLSVALIAIVTDRIIQSWSRRRKAALGMREVSLI
jgi:glycine betaine/proline transport system permease protein